MKELDTVKLLKEHEGIKAGTIGVNVCEYDGTAFEVEFRANDRRSKSEQSQSFFDDYKKCKFKVGQWVKCRVIYWVKYRVNLSRIRF